jgi:deoxyribodipyrimidine photolyase-like uncharacterized protein
MMTPDNPATSLDVDLRSGDNFCRNYARNLYWEYLDLRHMKKGTEKIINRVFLRTQSELEISVGG